MLVASGNILQLKRQYYHWMLAIERLSIFENHASQVAWKGVDKQLSDIIYRSLMASVEHAAGYGKSIKGLFESESNYNRIRSAVQRLRDMYIKAEKTVHFFTEALNSRTNESIASLLSACDILCVKSMQRFLKVVGKTPPLVLTYVQTGLGASILKANMRLWDGNIIPVAAIKITLHNLFRPTAILHESGHQIAQMLDWNRELANEFHSKLQPNNKLVAEAYASWSSEIAADAYSFAFTGYASVSALHNVVAGENDSVFRYHLGDPHPISYVRVLLNTAMCRHFYGAGEWDHLEASFKHDYPIEQSELDSIPLVKLCVEVIPEVVKIIFETEFRCFNLNRLDHIINPGEVSPDALSAFANAHGPSLFTSSAILQKECIRLLALNGYRIASQSDNIKQEYKLQEQWMTRLGMQVQLN